MSKNAKKKIGKKMISEGVKRIKESEAIQHKGKKIKQEKQRYAEKIENRIAEGKLIKKEAKKLIKKGEEIVGEENLPEKDGGVRNIIMGKRLRQAGQQRIEDYKEKLEKTDAWITSAEDLIEKGQEVGAEGKMLKKHGKKLIRDIKNGEKH